LVRKQATTLIASGIPEGRTRGYWNNVGRCCGAAGVGEFFLGLYTATKAKCYLAFAERVALYLISKAEPDENGTKWTQSDRRIEPDNVVAQTGLMQGAAGIGLFLAHLDAVRHHRKPVVRFPDEPIWEGLPTPNIER
jgi:lanthionine synthetase-like protein